MPAFPTPAAPCAWTVILPVKPLVRAKTRLAAAVDGTHRARLALAFAQDAVAAALRCAVVDEVIVVTADPRAAEALSALGARVLAEPHQAPPPRVSADGDAPDRGPERGLNAAVAHAGETVRRERPGRPLAVLSADLPALHPEELGRALTAAARHPRAFLADADGLGTTLLTAGPGAALGPAFGGASRARHAASGAVELAPGGVASVRRDVDTPADLRAALRLGVGPFTARCCADVPGAAGRRPTAGPPASRGA